MNRRRLLGVLTGGFSIAGCLSRDSDPNESKDPPGDPSTVFTLGETTGDVNPHGLTVRNTGEISRTVELCVTNADTDELLLDQSYSIDGGDEIAGELRGPAEYEVQVTVANTDTEHVTTVNYFDTCNDYETTVTVSPDETISSRTMKTDQECQT